MSGQKNKSLGVWQLLKKRRLVKISLALMVFLALIALLAPLIANDKPLYFSFNGESFYPAFTGDEFGIIGSEKKERINFTDAVADGDVRKIMPLIPYAPHKSDLDNSDYKGPGDYQYRIGVDGSETELTGLNRHLLGTGKRGEDLLAGLIHGTRVSLSVGLLAMIIAGSIGIILGAFAGYFGDQHLKVSRANFWMLILGIIPAWFYAFRLRHFEISDALAGNTLSFVFQVLLSLLFFAIILTIFFYAGSLLKWIPMLQKKVLFPVDTYISRLIEVITSLPRLILIISLAAIARPSLTNLVLIIGITSWTEIARFTRAEMLKVRNLEYIQSAQSMGFSTLRIIFVHALPNAIAPALVAITFGIASAILVESGLSFLGIGVPQNIVTWGSLLAAGKENFQAWWLVVFPGIAIFLTVTIYNLLGEALRDAMDPKLRN